MGLKRRDEANIVLPANMDPTSGHSMVEAFMDPVLLCLDLEDNLDCPYPRS